MSSLSLFHKNKTGSTRRRNKTPSVTYGVAEQFVASNGMVEILVVPVDEETSAVIDKCT